MLPLISIFLLHRPTQHTHAHTHTHARSHARPSLSQVSLMLRHFRPLWDFTCCVCICVRFDLTGVWFRTHFKGCGGKSMKYVLIESIYWWRHKHGWDVWLKYKKYVLNQSFQVQLFTGKAEGTETATTERSSNLKQKQTNKHWRKKNFHNNNTANL